MKMTTMDSIAGLNRALRSLEPEAKKRLTAESQEIAGLVADDARSRAAALGRGWKYLAPTIKAERSSKPSIKMGGARRLRKGARQTVGDLTFGLEFGALRYPQFYPHRGTIGYAMWPAVRDNSDMIRERYSKALLEALEAMA